MAFVFGQPFTHDRFFSAYYSFSWSPDDMTVSLNMMALWTNFAKYGYGHLTRKAVHSIWRCEWVPVCVCVCVWGGGGGVNQVCMPPPPPFNQMPLINRLHNNNQTSTSHERALCDWKKNLHTHTHTHQYTHTQTTTEEITHTHTHTYAHTRARTHTHARARSRTHKQLKRSEIENTLARETYFSSSSSRQEPHPSGCGWGRVVALLLGQPDLPGDRIHSHGSHRPHGSPSPVLGLHPGPPGRSCGIDCILDIIIVLKVLVKDLVYLGPWDRVQARYNYRQGFSQGFSICRSMALVESQWWCQGHRTVNPFPVFTLTLA